MKKKAFFMFDSLGGWIVTIATLVLVVWFIIEIFGKGDAILEIFKNRWRFGR